MHDMVDADWERLLHQLESGDCTPFLGPGACTGTLPAGSALSRRLAKKWGYPYGDDHELPRVAQFALIKYGDAVYVKNMICSELGASGLPDFQDLLEPHGLLANFPLPVYLTTNYDDFIVQSLKAVGKRPNPALCPWNADVPYAGDLFSREDGWNPQADRPLVYHLHGSLRDPVSIVVAEDDYLEFLTNLALDSAGRKQMLPPSILAALTKRSLLFVGYSLKDWTFRVLFRGLLRAVPGINRRRHVSIQLEPTPDPRKANLREVKHHLARYYEGWQISVFWGSSEQFCGELRRRMGSVQ
ncbi:SIR2 family NAD-dependent protein deacylase [Planobispora longispora]|uniref:SIR2-like domain-containing protein n=1 Tax=Planobispora longispora TaxID=28887 RepID=A0A8J3RR19_9ACTN|nr:SIR2 family protein [Planobispora longispora]GIH80227.1 hypothetical protein Plo01_66560 [Planobispora longispora]